ncbi:MAG: hypothetical protein U0235_18795 [Polyangiaceae bacterium]
MKLVGLLLSVVLLAVIVWLAMPTRPHPNDGAAVPSAAASLGEAPPADFGRNAAATKEYMARQVCLAECASDHRACKTIGADPAATAACDETRAACEGRCP